MSADTIDRSDDDRRVACHGNCGPCADDFDGICDLRAGHVRLVAQRHSEALDHAFSAGARGETADATIASTRCDEASDDELRAAWADGVASRVSVAW